MFKELPPEQTLFASLFPSPASCKWMARKLSMEMQTEGGVKFLRGQEVVKF